MKKIVLVIAIMLVILIIFLLSFFYYRINQVANTPILITEKIYFTLPLGANRSSLTNIMKKEQIVKDNDPFLFWYLRINSRNYRLKAGTYQLSPRMTIQDFLTLLASGKEAQFSIQFIEGTRFKDWLVTFSQAAYLNNSLANLSDDKIKDGLGLSDLTSFEGCFYPNTYYYTANTDSIRLLQRAHLELKNMLDKVWQSRATNLPYQDPYQLLIMASIIEKEAGLESERPLVASVFINRLNKGMRLQTDPTVIYGMGDDYKGVIRNRDLHRYTPYNTYLIKGLPPTPIAMVSQSSLNAAAHPAKSNYLYFVANGSGGHVFSSTLEEHNRAVRNYINLQRLNKQKVIQQ